MSSIEVHLLSLPSALVLALTTTPVVRAIARKRGMLASPKTDRWHEKPTAMLGGVAIFVSVTLSYLLFLPYKSQELVVITASAFLFGVGLVDDLAHIKPYQKLIGQIMGTSLIIFYGLNLPWTSSGLVNMAVTIFWLVGITNAINLLDNMDGLAGGIAAISSVFLALNFLDNGQQTEAIMIGLLAAALAGFLLYNSNPASIFMGDSGSMFVGFFLASSALLSPSGAAGRSRSFLPVLAIPILILFIPIFDTTLVTVLRKLAGRAASQGGRDHTSHRLVALGLSERKAVWMLYGFAALSGILSMLIRRMSVDLSVATLLGFTVVLTLAGVFLAGVKVYDEEEIVASREKPLVSFLIDLSYKRRIFEVLLDVILIILSYYSAYTLLYGPVTQEPVWGLFVRTVPVLVFLKMFTLLAMGVYRGLWRYISLNNLIIFAKSVLVGSVASVLALLFAFRFEGLSRAVFVLDGLIFFLFLAGSRVAFRLFRQMLPLPAGQQGRRILIYGAGDGGELLLRELNNNRDLNLTPVGFLDDDPLKLGKVIHGLRVYSGDGKLRTVCEAQSVSEILISSSRFSRQRIEEIKSVCDDAQVVLRRMRIQIEPVGDDDY